MVFIKCNNSDSKSVCFARNGGRQDAIIAWAQQGDEYWFTIGSRRSRDYKSLKTAKAAAVREMAALGYTFDPEEMAALEF